MQSHNITVRATEHTNANEAFAYLKVSGDDRAIRLGGKYLTLKQDELDRIEASGVEFALLSVHNGKIMTIPVNDR
jgi:hypothetical protein